MIPARARSARPRARTRHGRGDRGSVAVELAIAAPAVLAMLMVAIFGGRVVWAERQVSSAASAAARAASMQGTVSGAEAEAAAVATGNVTDAGVSCTAVAVDVTTGAAGFTQGGTVTVEVTCQADLSGLTFVGAPGTMSVDATATEVIDELRGDG